MNNYLRCTFTLLLVFLMTHCLIAQEDSESFDRNQVSLAIGHAHIPSATAIDSDRFIAIVPSYAISYAFRFTEKFSISAFSDFEISNYVIEDENGQSLERENPISLCLKLEYKVLAGWGFFAGGGYEFEKTEGLGLAVLGTFYEVEFNKHWDLTPELLVELKGGHTYAYTFALGVGYNF